MRGEPLLFPCFPARRMTAWPLADHPFLLASKHPEDRERYAAVKREAAAASREAGESVQDYTFRKEFVIKEILDRAFKAQGLLE